MATTDIDYVPSKIVSERGFTYNPNLSVTVKDDVQSLNMALWSGDISEDAYMKKMEDLLPNFDREVYGKTNMFGQKQSKLAALEYTSTLASKEEASQLHKNKMAYINTQVQKGDTVSNTGMDFSDWKLQDDLSRSELFMTRKKKFLDKYPQGAYTLMTLSAYDDEPVELFKKNKDDTEWQFRLPYGRDVGEWGVMSSQVFSTRMLNNVIATLISPPTGIRTFGTLVAADYLGQQAGKTIEQLRGYGEQEFQGEFGVGTLKNYFTNLASRDMKEAGMVGGSQIFLNRIMNYFTKKDKSLFGLFGLAKGADRYSAAFEELIAAGYNIDPIVHAQLLAWPILRGSFFQAKDFVAFPRNIIGAQSTKLYNQFERFGAKLAAEGGGKGDELSFGNLVKINQEFEAALGNMLKPTTNVVEKAKMMQNILNLAKKWDKTSYTTEKIMKNAAGKMARTEGINFSVGSLKTMTKLLQKEANVPAKGLEYTEKQIAKAAKLGIKLPPRKVRLQAGYKSSELNTLLNNITKLDDTLMRQKGGKNWSEVTDQLVAMRRQALALTTHPDDQVRGAARELYSQIKKISSKANGASEEFGVVWNQFNKALDENDLIRQTIAMKKAVNTGELDAATFANQFLDPRLPDTSSLLMKIIPEDQLPNVQNSFLNNMTREPKKMGAILDDWLANNPEGLKNLIGEPRIKELQALKIIADKFDNSILNKAISQSDEFTPVEFIKFVEKTAQAEGLGKEAAVRKLIDGFGGMESAEMSQIRSGIINNILRKSSDKGTKSIYDSAGELAIDPAKFFVELEKLSDDKVLSKLFTKDHLNTIKNFDLYTQAISAMEDVGGKIAAAEQRSAVMQAALKPKKLIGVFKTILSYNLMSRVLGSPLTAAKISKLGPNIYTEKGILAMRNILATLLGDLKVSPMLLGPEEDVKKGIVIDYAPSSITPGKQSIINKVIESEQGAYPGSEMDKIISEQNRNAVDVSRANIPDGSRLAAGFSPAGMFGTSTDPNLYAKGQQLFNKPGEITFASKGGIMSTNKAFQRVA